MLTSDDLPTLRPEPSRRSALDSWLSRADELLTEQREHSISPSTFELGEGDHPYQADLEMHSVVAGLELILDRLVAKPGRWILVLDTTTEISPYFVQYMVFEDGSLLAETNRSLDDPQRLTGEQAERLKALGWNPPTTGNPNWSARQRTTNPYTRAAARLGIATLKKVYGAGDDDVVRLELFSSPRRGGTPASR